MNPKYSHIDAFVVLCGGLVETPDGNWRTTTFDDSGDHVGILGDRLRIDAASYLYRDIPGARFIVSGGKGHLQIYPNAPAMAPIMRKELLETGVPDDHIIVDDKTNSTYRQIMAIERYSKEYGFNTFGIISNDFHLPRIEAMCKHLNPIPALLAHIQVTLISAEEVCIDADKERWEPIIYTAYHSDAMKKRITLEQKGVADIVAGHYDTNFKDTLQYGKST